MSLSNSLGLLGRKVGMMRLFTDDGDAVPVTVVDVSNNRVTQVKTQENDGYVALQVTFGARKASRVTKPIAGHLAKAGVEAGEIIQEFKYYNRRQVMKAIRISIATVKQKLFLGARAVILLFRLRLHSSPR